MILYKYYTNCKIYKGPFIFASKNAPPPPQILHTPVKSTVNWVIIRYTFLFVLLFWTYMLCKIRLIVRVIIPGLFLGIWHCWFIVLYFDSLSSRRLTYGGRYLNGALLNFTLENNPTHVFLFTFMFVLYL